MKYISLLCLALLFLGMASCTENTAYVGDKVIPDQDMVKTTQQIYNIATSSVLGDSVLVKSDNFYLGAVIDPANQSVTKCDFLAQFHVSENSFFPNKEQMILNNGNVMADSCDIILYVRNYVGDPDAIMKLSVQELDTLKTLNESKVYYSNIDPSKYYTVGKGVHMTMSYAVNQMQNVEAGKSVNYKKLKIRLPQSYGSYMLRKFYENPSFFKNSYNFIHHVCPGFYFKIDGSLGSMIQIESSSLNIYFRYHKTVGSEKDSIVEGYQRMAATPEVIQTTRVVNSIPNNLLNADLPYTYVKSPGGIYTEAVLPIDEVYGSRYKGDSLNLAKVVFTRYKTDNENREILSPPATLLMIRKKDIYSFFNSDANVNLRTSYLSDYNAALNAYIFNNIATLLSSIKQEREAGAGIQVGDTEMQRMEKYKRWEDANPDWNKVALLPVKTDFFSKKNESKKLLRIRNDLQMSSVALAGGKSGKVQLSVVYSSFNK